MKNLSVIMLIACVLAAQSAVAGLSAVHAAEKASVSCAPDFTLQDVDQARVYTLSSYRQRQPVLLFFWTTWCPFCQQALKSLSMMHEELNAKGVQVLAVNLGEGSAKVRHAVSYYKLPFPVLLDERSSTIDDYNLLGVPTYIVINKEGQIIARDNYLPKNKLMELLKDA